ncbi:MAG: 23S rRNA (guanosine(2251)-2'-O)-methyltransferase RlmB [Clostridia bacterium]|nr:23S rRNA (guanosine(2251)-2'-O)-methyltransferase RlmB [Clostridia bacterium]
MYRKDERGGYHGSYEKKEFGRKPDFKKNAPRPQADRRPPKPAPAVKPAVVEEEVVDNILTGRNPIREALKSGRDIEKLMVAKGDLSGTAREIVAMAHEVHVPVQMVERIRLDEIAKNHQGMIAFASAYQYADVDDMLEVAAQRGEAPFLIILDGVTDPHNLGAVIRTAAAVGAHGVIVPERRAVGLTPAAVKASAGGVEHIKVARVVNLTNEIKRLQSKGIWLYGADADGEDYRKVNFSGACAIVIGSEGDGISRLVREQCDHIVSIPMKNPAMESLNASVAAGILMYAAAAARD